MSAGDVYARLIRADRRCQERSTLQLVILRL